MTTENEDANLDHAMSLLTPQERAALADDGADEGETMEQVREVETSDRKTNPKLSEPTEDTGSGNDLSTDDDEGLTSEEKKIVDAQDEEDLKVEGIAAEIDKPIPEPEGAADPLPGPVETLATPPDAQFNYVAPAVEDYENRLSALQIEKSKALKQLLAAEITDDEYAAIDTRAMAQMNALSQQQTRHELARDMREQQELYNYTRQVNQFKAQAKAEGLDYDAPENQKYSRAMDGLVRHLAVDPENNDKSGDWFLKEAHRIVKLQYNLPTAAVKPAEAPKPAPAKVVKPRIPDLSKIPPTLGKAPAAAQESEGDSGEFAHLEKLQGLALERALARMTPEQEERYLTT